MAFHMTGIYQVYTKKYIWYIPGIFQVYTVCRHMSGIYQVYTMIINFLGFPDEYDGISNCIGNGLPVIGFKSAGLPAAIGFQSARTH